MKEFLSKIILPFLVLLTLNCRAQELIIEYAEPLTINEHQFDYEAILSFFDHDKHKNISTTAFAKNRKTFHFKLNQTERVLASFSYQEKWNAHDRLELILEPNSTLKVYINNTKSFSKLYDYLYSDPSLKERYRFEGELAKTNEYLAHYTRAVNPTTRYSYSVPIRWDNGGDDVLLEFLDTIEARNLRNAKLLAELDLPFTDQANLFKQYIYEKGKLSFFIGRIQQFSHLNNQTRFDSALYYQLINSLLDVKLFPLTYGYLSSFIGYIDLYKFNHTTSDSLYLTELEKEPISNLSKALMIENRYKTGFYEMMQLPYEPARKKRYKEGYTDTLFRNHLKRWAHQNPWYQKMLDQNWLGKLNPNEKGAQNRGIVKVLETDEELISKIFNRHKNKVRLVIFKNFYSSSSISTVLMDSILKSFDSKQLHINIVFTGMDYNSDYSYYAQNNKYPVNHPQISYFGIKRRPLLDEISWQNHAQLGKIILIDKQGQIPPTIKGRYLKAIPHETYFKKNNIRYVNTLFSDSIKYSTPKLMPYGLQDSLSLTLMEQISLLSNNDQINDFNSWKNACYHNLFNLGNGWTTSLNLLESRIIKRNENLNASRWIKVPNSSKLYILKYNDHLKYTSSAIQLYPSKDIIKIKTKGKWLTYKVLFFTNTHFYLSLQ